MKNIYVLPTDKPSRLFITDGKLFNYQKPQQADWVKIINQNIYITSDEEIKIGDWVYCKDDNAVIQLETNLSVMFANDQKEKFGFKTFYKIILTTDQDLIKDGVQAIDDEFIEWFVKNTSCERVEVTYGVLKPFQSEDKGYLIHFPDNEVLEEPKQETLEELAIQKRNELGLKGTIDGFIAGFEIAKERMYSEEDLKEAFSMGRTGKTIEDFNRKFRNK